MIPLTTFCDDYIDRPNLTQQKNPFEYIIPPPTIVSQNNRINTFTLFVLDDVRVLPLCIKSILCAVYRQIVPHLYMSFQ